VISWYLADSRLTSVDQTNVTERQMSDRWRSESVLSHKFGIQDSGSVLRCRVTHAGYSHPGHTEVEVKLEVIYKPIVSIKREDSDDQLEDGLGSVKLFCNVNSNPASTVVWSRLDPRTGVHKTVHHGKDLVLEPVRRENGGTYICTASNSVGQSDPGQTVVNVLYPPTKVATSPSEKVKVSVNNSTRLHCQADGNPPPKYQWMQGGEPRSYSEYLDLEKGVGHTDTRSYLVSVTNMHGTDSAPVQLTVRAPMPLTSAITAASVLALALIMLVCTCIVCRNRRKLCFKVKAEKDIVAQSSFTNKAESKISLVNETKEKLPEGISPLKINPHSTKV